MDMKVGPDDVADTLLARENITDPTSRQTDNGLDRSVMPASAWNARVSDLMEQWPMQKLAIDMVEFAEELHQALPIAGNPPGLTIESLCLKLMQLEASLTTLLARSGINRADPIDLASDADSHHNTAGRRASHGVPETVVQNLSSTWTLNGQLLRPAMVVVSPAQPEQRSAGAVTSVSSSSPTKANRHD